MRPAITRPELTSVRDMTLPETLTAHKDQIERLTNNGAEFMLAGAIAARLVQLGRVSAGAPPGPNVRDTLAVLVLAIEQNDPAAVAAGVRVARELLG